MAGALPERGRQASESPSRAPTSPSPPLPGSGLGHGVEERPAEEGVSDEFEEFQNALEAEFGAQEFHGRGLAKVPARAREKVLESRGS